MVQLLKHNGMELKISSTIGNMELTIGILSSFRRYAHGAIYISGVGGIIIGIIFASGIFSVGEGLL